MNRLIIVHDLEQCDPGYEIRLESNPFRPEEPVTMVLEDKRLQDQPWYDLTIEMATKVRDSLTAVIEHAKTAAAQKPETAAEGTE